MSSVNLSKTETREWPLKTLPRLKGKSTQVVITEYDLPSNMIQPHDVILDQQGIVWYSDFGQQFLGKMDPKTGKVTQYPIPLLKQGWPTGTLDLEADKDGNIWVGVMYQANIAKFDPKTEKFEQWSVPKEWQTDAAQTGHLAVGATHVDGKVWIKNSDETNIYRLDVKTGKFEDLGNQTDPFNGRRIGTYGIHSGFAEQRLSAGLLGQQSRAHRRQDQGAQVLQDADRDVASAPRAGRFTRPAVVRRIWRQRDRHARSEVRRDQGMESADSRGARRMTRSSTSMATPGQVRC